METPNKLFPGQSVKLSLEQVLPCELDRVHGKLHQYSGREFGSRQSDRLSIIWKEKGCSLAWYARENIFLGPIFVELLGSVE